MVVAELPLWVVHGGVGGTSATPGNDSSTTQRREDSLALLLSRQTKTAIYSIDASPTNNIFATAGGDGAIRIWNSNALFPQPRNLSAAHFEEDTGTYVSSSGGSSIGENEESSIEEDASGIHIPAPSIGPVHDLTARRKDGTAITAALSSNEKKGDAATKSSSPTLPSVKRKSRLLCTLTAHTGSSVLCVRFSHSGDFLASAGDDACVCIYTRQTEDASQWIRTKLCRGHGLDVVDLAWAPDDSHLVSCSLDSSTPIIVWKPTTGSSSSMICNPYKVLGEKIHTSTVKGVAFDPAGSYVASSGDDPAVCIWRAHDDWGLEARIDSGIFRQWKDIDSLSEDSHFRRISWSTDGSFICTTNAVVKNKHVASTISREGWAVATAGTASGAANLVGHTQPVVVSRHSPNLLSMGKSKRDDGESSDEEDAEDGDPEYATLLALGDRVGFVTVWSTKKSRPIFKLQCSESRCTVSDLSWATLSNGDLMLLVSLLDGQIVALRFSVPDEIGPLLTAKEKSQIFRLRYGIDTDDDFFVGQSSGPRLIENTLQMTLEEQQNEDDGEKDMDVDSPMLGKPRAINTLEPRSIKDQQKESRSKGKRRVQPVLMQVEPQAQKRPKATPEKSPAPKDPVQQAIEVAEMTKTPDAIDPETRRKATPEVTTNVPPSNARAAGVRERQPLLSALPHSKERLYSVDLPLSDSSEHNPLTIDPAKKFVFECSNVTKVPTGSKGGAISCVEVTVKSDGRTTWKDTIPGSSCCALAASKHLAAVGTTDGSILLFGTSPSLGWSNGSSFRSHPPLIAGHPIIALQLQEYTAEDGDETTSLKMLVLAADGFFAVYCLEPDLCLEYKGSILPAIAHMSFSVNQVTQYPELSRALLLENGSVVILLSFFSVGQDTTNTAPSDCGPGGALQAFAYLRNMEMWIRTSDSRFVLSDFYTTLPTPRNLGGTKTVLSDMDDAVRLGSLHSTLKAPHRARFADRQANLVYTHLDEESGNFLASRSHCEDRMACAFALQSASEFKLWLGSYIRVLVAGGLAVQLRHLVDVLMPRPERAEEKQGGTWWMGRAATVLGMDRVGLVRSLLLTEVGKNRDLQRFANEVSMQLDAVSR